MKKISLILISVLMISCGSRKVNNSSTTVGVIKTEVTKDTIIVKKETTEEVVDTSEIFEIIYEPIDSSKSFFIDGKEYKNIKYTKRKTKKGVSTSKSDKSVSNQGKITKSGEKITIKDNKKQTNRENYSYYWIILVLIVFIITYLIYRNYERTNRPR